MEAERNIDTGDVLGERFELKKRLGEGGAGVVFAAFDRKSGHDVAVKVLHQSSSQDATIVERFRREGEALRAIQHPAIVGFEDVGTLSDGTLFLALELLRGENLEDRLERYGAMIPEITIPIVRGICAGITAAHEAGIIHRDIKTANIFLPDWSEVEDSMRTGSTPIVKIVDFGIAKAHGQSSLTRTGIAVGTTRSMAPEQLRGQDIDRRTDVYAIGLIAFEMLTGEHPFFRQRHELVKSVVKGRFTPLREIRPSIGREVEAVVHRAMSLRPEDRPHDARTFAREYAAAVEGMVDEIARGLGSIPMRASVGNVTGPLEAPVLPARPKMHLAPPKDAKTPTDTQPKRKVIPTTRPPPANLVVGDKKIVIERPQGASAVSSNAGSQESRPVWQFALLGGLLGVALLAALGLVLYFTLSG